MLHLEHNERPSENHSLVLYVMFIDIERLKERDQEKI
jgi:hypothetical protein